MKITKNNKSSTFIIFILLCSIKIETRGATWAIEDSVCVYMWWVRGEYSRIRDGDKQDNASARGEKCVYLTKCPITIFIPTPYCYSNIYYKLNINYTIEFINIKYTQKQLTVFDYVQNIVHVPIDVLSKRCTVISSEFAINTSKLKSVVINSHIPINSKIEL